MACAAARLGAMLALASAAVAAPIDRGLTGLAPADAEPTRFSPLLDLSNLHTLQSTTSYGDAANAIDGDAGTHTATYFESEPWWRIELGKETVVHGVTVTRVPTPSDLEKGYSDYLNGLEITVGGKPCASVTTFGQADTKDIMCAAPVTGAVVQLKMPRVGKVGGRLWNFHKQTLSLREVKILSLPAGSSVCAVDGVLDAKDPIWGPIWGNTCATLTDGSPPGVYTATTIKTVVNGFCYNDGKSTGYIYDSWGHSEASCTEQCGARGDCVASQFLGGRCTLFKASGCTGSAITSDGRIQNLWCNRYYSPGCAEKVVNGFCYNDGKSTGYIYDSWGHSEASCTEQCGARGDCVASQFLGGRCTLFKASGCTGSAITSDGRIQNLWCNRYVSPGCPPGQGFHLGNGEVLDIRFSGRKEVSSIEIETGLGAADSKHMPRSFKVEYITEGGQPKLAKEYGPGLATAGTSSYRIVLAGDLMYAKIASVDLSNPYSNLDWKPAKATGGTKIGVAGLRITNTGGSNADQWLRLAQVSVL